MMRRIGLFIVMGLVGVLGPTADAADPWVVRDFRVEGAQWISEGTIYNYLPINIGDTLVTEAEKYVQPAGGTATPRGAARHAARRAPGVAERPAAAAETEIETHLPSHINLS